jgi:hypothetical protein
VAQIDEIRGNAEGAGALGGVQIAVRLADARTMTIYSGDDRQLVRGAQLIRSVHSRLSLVVGGFNGPVTK